MKIRNRLVMALCAIALASACKSEIDGKQAATVTEPTATTEEAPAEGANKPAEGEAKPVTVPLDTAKTTVEWVGAKITLDHKGGFKGVKGEATIGADGALTAVRAEVDTTTVYSDAEKLTGHLKGPDFFDVEKFPTSTFESKSITKNEDGTYTVTGTLELRGVKKEISFPATIKTEGDMVTASAEFTLKRFDFGIVYKGKADDLIKDEVLMKLNLAAEKPADS